MRFYIFQHEGDGGIKRKNGILERPEDINGLRDEGVN